MAFIRIKMIHSRSIFWVVDAPPATSQLAVPPQDCTLLPRPKTKPFRYKMCRQFISRKEKHQMPQSLRSHRWHASRGPHPKWLLDRSQRTRVVSSWDRRPHRFRSRQRKLWEIIMQEQEGWKLWQPRTRHLSSIMTKTSIMDLGLQLLARVS